MKTHVDWGLLIPLREHGQRMALAAVAAHRRAERGAAADSERAAHARDRQIAVRLDHLQQLRGRVDAGHCALSDLRQAADYLHVLDARVETATATLRRSLEHRASARDALVSSLQQLRSATAALRAAQEMRTRAARQAAALRELRAEENAEEASRQQWRQLRRPPPRVVGTRAQRGTDRA